jgi:glucokinase
MNQKLVIGVDIGGSHISCSAFDLIEKKLRKASFAESKLNNHSAGEIIFSCWAKTIQQTFEKVGKENVVGIGFAMPSPFDYEKGIPLFTGENNKYENIYGVDISAMLRKMLQLPDEFPIRFINDASAFAIGEDWFGKARGTKKSLSITLGTGIGSAFIENSLPITSGVNVPPFGSVWHLPFEGGIADDYFSSRGLLNRYFEKTGKSISSVKDLASLAQNDIMVKDLFESFGTELISFLAPWLKKFGVEKMVIGGNISRAAKLFLPSMQTALMNMKLASITIDISELGETAAIIGSARLLEPQYWQKVKYIIKDM